MWAPSSPERWRRVKELFGAALDRPPAERDRLLLDAVREDAALAAEVRILLEAHEREGQFLEEIVAGEGQSLVEGLEESSAAGRRIGPYELLDRIGSGGMGSVYLARRADEEFEELVAIKLVRPGVFSGQALRRFRFERQTLANLNHPGIARLLDGGTTSDGVPYLVMEHVAGSPIDAFCQSRSLPLEQRLRLFRDVCEAVQHAHRNLVVHRDLKPSNILVTEAGQVKLLDFGIARLLPEAGEETEGLTRTFERVMTPEYASPEQIRGEPVTTASDVYSLGVLFYRLLTGEHPYRFESDRPSDIERVVCEREPRRPSTAAARTGEAGTPRDAARLRRRLKGDLDNIALKALQKEPARRYGSAEQLSEDIGRYLRGEPVRARKVTFSYRASKFVRRHRVGVAAAALVGLSLVGGLAMSLRSAQAARLEAAKAERINAFINGIFGAASPWQGGRGITVAEVLGNASRRAGRELAGQPEVEAAVRSTIGGTYVGLGLYDLALPEVRRALDLRRRALGPDHDEIAASLGDLAGLLSARGDLEGAEAPAREALAMRQRLHGDTHETVGAAWNLLGSLLLSKGDLDGAEAAHRRALAIYQGVAPEGLGMAETLNDLAVVLGTRGRSSEAEPLHRRALAIARKLYPGPHPDVAAAMTTLASMVWDARRDAAEAEALYREALEIRRATLGEDHPDVTWTLYNFAYMEMEKGDFIAAERLAREALKPRGSTLPDEHPIVASALQVAGRCRMAQGDPAGALPLLSESLALRERALPADHWLVAASQSFLGECLGKLGRYAEAESLLRRGFDSLRASRGPDNPRTKEAAERLAALYEQWNRPGQARRVREENEKGGAEAPP